MLEVGASPESDPAVGEAAGLIRAGEVVAFPTETVYGLGADATSPEAVERIYRAKQRPRDNPAIVHIASMDDLARVALDRPQAVERLAAGFWPGPLTLVLRARPEISAAVSRGLETVAVRMPAHAIARALITLSGRPIAAPSANLSGRPSPTTAAHVLEDLGGRIPLILDGGACAIGLESTVLDLTAGEPLILRPGRVTREDLEAALGSPVRDEGDAEARRRSPGTRYRHYTPRAPVVLVPGACDSGALVAWAERLRAEDEALILGYIGWRAELGALPYVRFHEVRAGDAGEQAAILYDAFRDFDARGAHFILCDEPPATEFGAAVRERLSRAASFVFEKDEPRRR